MKKPLWPQWAIEPTCSSTPTCAWPDASWRLLPPTPPPARTETSRGVPPPPPPMIPKSPPNPFPVLQPGKPAGLGTYVLCALFRLQGTVLRHGALWKLFLSLLSCTRFKPLPTLSLQTSEDLLIPPYGLSSLVVQHPSAEQRHLADRLIVSRPAHTGFYGH